MAMIEEDLYFSDGDFDLSLILDNVSDYENGSTSRESYRLSPVSGISTPSSDVSVLSSKRKLMRSRNNPNEKPCIGDDVSRTNEKNKNDQPIAKRKRRRYPNAKDANGKWLVPSIPLPRILKSDIRRSYGVMFANVYNSVDYGLMTNFIQQFICEDYTYRFSKIGVTKTLRGSKELLGQFWFDRMMDAPDVKFDFVSDQIKVRSNGTAVLTGNFKISGTKIILQEQNIFPIVVEYTDDASNQETPYDYSHHINSTDSSSSENNGTDSEISDDSEIGTVSLMNTLQDGCSIDFVHRYEIGGTISLHMDARYMISLVDMGVTSMSIQPLTQNALSV